MEQNKNETTPKTMVFDLDGTMYRGVKPIEAGIRAINYLHDHNIPYLFLTNNSMRTPEENAQYMLDMGYSHIEPRHFFNSSMASAAYVKKYFPQKNKAWYVGANGLKQALLEEGFEITDQNPDFVFVGLDKNANYQNYSKALDLLLNGAKLIGTNYDRILAKPEGFEVGNGAVVHLLEFASSQESPKIGKPDWPILEAALHKANLKKEDIVLIGDNLETDIALGYNNQVQTVLVQTGVHHEEDISKFQIYPDHVVKSLDDLDFIGISKR